MSTMALSSAMSLGAETIGRLTEIGEPCVKASAVLPFAAGVQRG